MAGAPLQVRSLSLDLPILSSLLLLSSQQLRTLHLHSDRFSILFSFVFSMPFCASSILVGFTEMERLQRLFWNPECYQTVLPKHLRYDTFGLGYRADNNNILELNLKPKAFLRTAATLQLQCEMVDFKSAHTRLASVLPVNVRTWLSWLTVRSRQRADPAASACWVAELLASLHERSGARRPRANCAVQHTPWAAIVRTFLKTRPSSCY